MTEGTKMSERHDKITAKLSEGVSRLSFLAPVAFVQNPLEYARSVHLAYWEKFGAGQKEAVFVGMNPGPWGMAQTGVPFGEVSAVAGWMGLSGEIKKPAREHPKRKVEGFACRRSEVSGKRLWGWAASRFGTPEKFFSRFFVLNYCPLIFMEEGGKNITPDKLRPDERAKLFPLCDEALRSYVKLLGPRLVVGVGGWAEARAREALPGLNVEFGRITHPSPANPAANRGWEALAEKELSGMGIKF